MSWQVYTWRQAHRFDVTASIQQEPVPVAEKRYEITVVVRNLGSSDEAVENVALLYSDHDAEVTEEGVVRGYPSLLDRKSEPLPPRAMFAEPTTCSARGSSNASRRRSRPS